MVILLAHRVILHVVVPLPLIEFPSQTFGGLSLPRPPVGSLQQFFLVVDHLDPPCSLLHCT
jgi:hypothetical protein